ncbi:hypothetical protein C8R46DRAFT_437258 [Mycena filopes]|nr:hypothetical protein C8R46DRAFT_437258 [Mycena filopes]
MPVGAAALSNRMLVAVGFCGVDVEREPMNGSVEVEVEVEVERDPMNGRLDVEVRPRIVDDSEVEVDFSSIMVVVVFFSSSIMVVVFINGLSIVSVFIGGSIIVLVVFFSSIIVVFFSSIIVVFFSPIIVVFFSSIIVVVVLIGGSIIVRVVFIGGSSIIIVVFFSPSIIIVPIAFSLYPHAVSFFAAALPKSAPWGTPLGHVLDPEEKLPSYSTRRLINNIVRLEKIMETYPSEILARPSVLVRAGREAVLGPDLGGGQRGAVLVGARALDGGVEARARAADGRGGDGEGGREGQEAEGGGGGEAHRDEKRASVCVG